MDKSKPTKPVDPLADWNRRFSSDHGPIKQTIGDQTFILPAASRRNINLANRLRNNPTVSEKNVRREIRIHLNKYACLFQHPLYGYVADFLFPAQKLIVEVNGPCHNTPERQKHDRIRAKVLTSHGYKILNIAAREVYAPDRLAFQIARIAKTLEGLASHLPHEVG